MGGSGPPAPVGAAASGCTGCGLHCSRALLTPQIPRSLSLAAVQPFGPRATASLLYLESVFSTLADLGVLQRASCCPAMPQTNCLHLSGVGLGLCIFEVPQVGALPPGPQAGPPPNASPWPALELSSSPGRSVGEPRADSASVCPQPSEQDGDSMLL